MRFGRLIHLKFQKLGLLEGFMDHYIMHVAKYVHSILTVLCTTVSNHVNHDITARNK